MRFTPDGPDIPHELLLARDQGRVIFFCGAGVSRAKANLPDFFGLAAKVTNGLGVSSDSPARKLIEQARIYERDVGIPGVISADRIFGLLEREFTSRDIEAAVATALRPTPSCDLSAHHTLLDLATTPEGVVQLVTTNFDRLFDDCDRGLKSWQPPALPDPSRPSEMNGIVYLHGKVTSQYDRAEGDGFVLSSSEFGRAYLSDGWATLFIRAIIENYKVVFVGYTADDPPVQYLLEALSKRHQNTDRIFAFQSGGKADAAERWRHKGVEAIAYDPANSHAALWKTLELWAARARNRDGWYQQIIERSKAGPEELLPHERGQVAHVISTLDGARKFALAEPAPPAIWLCVFDAYRRYARPGKLGRFSKQGLYVDPFDAFCLDSDRSPTKIDNDDYYSKRDIPNEAWDAFELTRLDREGLSSRSLPVLRGPYSDKSPQLPPRLSLLATWIARVANEPAAAWWAARQGAMHRDFQFRIRSELGKRGCITNKMVRRAWQFLLEVWSQFEVEADEQWYLFGELIEIEGWSTSIARRYTEARKPHFEIDSSSSLTPKPPTYSEELALSELMRVDVKYSVPHEEPDIPDDYLADIIRRLRSNLELAATLETEIGGYGLHNISPIIADSSAGFDSYDRTHGLSAEVIHFSNLFSRLVKVDSRKAHDELYAWPKDDFIFARFRIWAAGLKELVGDHQVVEILGVVSRQAFWKERHQRDLLLTLSARWKDLAGASRLTLEERILEGPEPWSEEDAEHFRERKAWAILNRLQWLLDQGCEFTFDLAPKIESLRREAPDWLPAVAENAVRSLETRGGWVKKVTEHFRLDDVPLHELLGRAAEMTGRFRGDFTEIAPYDGLVIARPVRAFLALISYAKRGEYPKWAWETFLGSTEARKMDRVKLICLISNRLRQIPPSYLAEFIIAASRWLSNVGSLLAEFSAETFDQIVLHLCHTIRDVPGCGQSALVRTGAEVDWATEAINAPVGILAEALFEDQRIKDLPVSAKLPALWVHHVNELLALSGDNRRYALVTLFRQLNWFYAIDPRWTEDRLLPFLSNNDQHDRAAAWSGLLRSRYAPNEALYVLLKPHLLTFALEYNAIHSTYDDNLAALLLLGWGATNAEHAVISSQEMRDLLLAVNDDFRVSVLRHLRHWSDNNQDANGDKWRELTLSFLREVWPRQLVAKSAKASAALCELAFSMQEKFVEVADIILPLLTKVESARLTLLNFKHEGSIIVEQHPGHVLGLLYAVLPEDVSGWPYGIEKILERLERADPRLGKDERLVLLKRRWDSR